MSGSYVSSFWSDEMHMFGKEDTGKVWDTVVAQADMANNSW
jgi:hypothetical protein